MNDLIILALLIDGPKHGYQLKRQAGFILGQGDMHNNLVYPALRRFHHKGWVTKKPQPGDRGHTRQQYVLTASGRKELLSRLGQYDEVEAASDRAFMTRVGMFELLDPEVRIHILDVRETYLRGREQRLAAMSNMMDTGAYGSEVIRHLEEQNGTELSWIRRLRRLGDAQDSPALKDSK